MQVNILVLVVGQKLCYGTSQTAGYHAVLHREQSPVSGGNLMEDLLVDRFEKNHIVVGNAESFQLSLFNRPGSIVADGSDGEQCRIRSPPEFSSLANGENLR